MLMKYSAEFVFSVQFVFVLPTHIVLQKYHIDSQLIVETTACQSIFRYSREISHITRV